MYRLHYPKLSDFSIGDVLEALRSRKVQRFEAAQKEKEDAEKEAAAKAADDDGKGDDDKKEDGNEQPEDAPKDGDGAKEKEDGDVAAKDGAKKEAESASESAESAPDRVLSAAELKVVRAAELLEDEYYGNEHSLYAAVCSKYGVVAEPEVFGVDDRATTSMTDRLLEAEEGLLCAECLELKPFTKFSRSELDCNGPFMACLHCEADRDSVEHCKWNSEWIANGVELENKDYVATIKQNGHRSAVAASKRPAVRGVHCWRWNFRNHKTWAVIGVSHPKQYGSSSYSEAGVYGVAHSSGGYRNRQSVNGLNAKHFYEGNEVLIDMKLDLGKHELSYRMVGDERVVKMDGIEKDNKLGFTPHINIYYQGEKVQVKKIPAAWFGKNPKRVKFKW